MISAHAQLARRYGLPSRSGGALTDSSYPDAQAAYESMLSLAVTVQNDIDLVLHAGGILSSYLAFSYEKLVIDDEMCGMVRRLREGIDVSPATLAYDVVASVGPGGNFLMEDHTVERCRTEFWQPAIADRGGLEAWMEGGRIDTAARARQRWQALVAGHEDPPLERTTALKLQSYLNSQIC
jgi:trimethylamine--corrinoid protein Co-methyltransferase